MTNVLGMHNKCRKKGIALFMVLMTILIVSLLANIVLNMMLSHARLSRHQISRTQAYYAGLAAMNMARANLQTRRWTFAPINSCPNPGGCIVADVNFPASIQNIRVIFCPAGATCQGVRCVAPAGTTFCIQTTATYTYNP